MFTNKVNLFRKARAKLFIKLIKPSHNSKILDLGGGDGSYINQIVSDYPGHIKLSNITIADYDKNLLKIAKKKYGFKTVLVDQSGYLPFKKNKFDIVFCNSVIEHATGNKKEIMEMDSKLFSKLSLVNQYRFAKEISRVGKKYFVQTPNKYFLIESHTMLPFIVIFLPRQFQIKISYFINLIKLRNIHCDWNLLDSNDMQKMFPGSIIHKEYFLFLTKSLIAVRK